MNAKEKTRLNWAMLMAIFSFFRIISPEEQTRQVPASSSPITLRRIRKGSPDRMNAGLGWSIKSSSEGKTARNEAAHDNKARRIMTSPQVAQKAANSFR